MLRRVALAGALIASVSCNRSEGGEGAGSAMVASAGSAGSAGPRSGGSFSADLAKELPGPTKGASTPGTAAGSGSAELRSGGAAPSEPKAADSAAGGAKPGAEPRPGDPAGGDKPAGDKPAGDKPSAGAQPAATREARPASADSAPAGQPGAGAAAGAQPTAEPAAQVSEAPARGPVKVPADLLAIKLSLLPNWDRDIGQAGTFQYVVRIKGTQGTKTFTFHYGYDEPRAPKDHEQYKKYLQDSRALTGEIRDRQRGAAWFLEGTDAAGMPAFRYVVLYGGKQLICYGSLYKDADSNRLGDDRDQTLIQAKQICETLAL
ncbi:MAG TPA: hypothetical protein VHT91_46500 [Kofleriaceae bacterium]|nr:hypothetical protein [Kofleriaceae bacterium]